MTDAAETLRAGLQIEPRHLQHAGQVHAERAGQRTLSMKASATTSLAVARA